VHNEGLTIASTLTTWLDALTTLGIDAEVIVVDDGSTDATPHLLDEAAAGDARLRVVHQRQGGHGRAVLAGYRAARGAWVFQFDGDDEIGAPAPRPRGVRRLNQRAPVRRPHAPRPLFRLAGCDIADPNVPFRLIARPTLEHALARMPRTFCAQWR
jgi:glycosyltransferase involved in cell wall biosynthesis